MEGKGNFVTAVADGGRCKRSAPIEGSKGVGGRGKDGE